VALGRILENREQRQQEQDDDHPQSEIAEIGVHRVPLLARRGVDELPLGCTVNLTKIELPCPQTFRVEFLSNVGPRSCSAKRSAAWGRPEIAAECSAV